MYKSSFFSDEFHITFIIFITSEINIAMDTSWEMDGDQRKERGLGHENKAAWTIAFPPVDQ